MGRPLRDVGLRLIKPFADLLPGLVDIHMVLENDGDDRQSEPGDRPEFNDIGNGGHGSFDGGGDVLFHLLCGQGRGNGDHLYLVVGDVGYRIYRELHERSIFPIRSGRGKQCDQKFILYGKFQDSVDHNSLRLDIRMG